jgi:hypothetical protein
MLVVHLLHQAVQLQTAGIALKPVAPVVQAAQRLPVMETSIGLLLAYDTVALDDVYYN